MEHTGAEGQDAGGFLDLSAVQNQGGPLVTVDLQVSAFADTVIGAAIDDPLDIGYAVQDLGLTIPDVDLDLFGGNRQGIGRGDGLVRVGNSDQLIFAGSGLLIDLDFASMGIHSDAALLCVFTQVICNAIVGGTFGSNRTLQEERLAGSVLSLGLFQGDAGHVHLTLDAQGLYLQLGIVVVFGNSVLNHNSTGLALDISRQRQFLDGLAGAGGKADPIIGQNGDLAIILHEQHTVLTVNLIIVADLDIEGHSALGNGHFGPHHGGRFDQAAAGLRAYIVFQADAVGTVAAAHVEDLLVIIGTLLPADGIGVHHYKMPVAVSGELFFGCVVSVQVPIAVGGQRGILIILKQNAGIQRILHNGLDLDSHIGLGVRGNGNDGFTGLQCGPGAIGLHTDNALIAVGHQQGGIGRIGGFDREAHVLQVRIVDQIPGSLQAAEDLAVHQFLSTGQQAAAHVPLCSQSSHQNVVDALLVGFHQAACRKIGNGIIGPNIDLNIDIHAAAILGSALDQSGGAFLCYGDNQLRVVVLKADT